jgi:hypothetical protein
MGMKSKQANRPTESEDEPPPSLGGLVHGVVNSTASIAFAASTLRAGGTLSSSELDALARIEQAAALVTETVKRFARAAPEPRPPTGEAGATLDLYELCCELAEALRRTQGRAIYCHAFGDVRGPWNRAQLTALVQMMLDAATTHLQPDTSLTLGVSGFGRHVRLSLQALGHLSQEAKEACLQIPSQVDPSLGGLLTVTVSRGPGTVLSMHLPR